MSQVTDRTVGANPSGFDMRTELNNIIGALETCNSGSSEPLNPVAFMDWFDTSNATYYYYKERNHDNTAWVTLFRYTVATKVMEVVSNGVVLQDSALVHKTGDETKLGVLTFNSIPIINGKNAISQDTTAYNVDTTSFVANTLASGAIIERGSNANGEYIKFVDGSLLCWGTRIFTLSSSVAGGAYFFPFNLSTYNFKDFMPTTYTSINTKIHSIVGDPTTNGTSDIDYRIYIWYSVVPDGSIYHTNRARNSGQTPIINVYTMESEGFTSTTAINSTVVVWSAVGRWK